jgi:transcriptional regulator
VANQSADALRGSLDLLALRTLSIEPMHGWGISVRVRAMSDGVLDVNQGSLYPALQRLEQRGLIQSEWRLSENKRQAKYYALTDEGRRAIQTETASWRRFAAAVEMVIGNT